MFVISSCRQYRVIPFPVPPVSEESGKWSEYFSEGNGTSDDPYIVASNEIGNIAMLVNSGETSFAGVVFQAEDMDLTGVDFTPIGTEENPFEGIFQGPSEKAEIKLDINRDNLDYIGLFGVLGNHAEVRNLSVSGKIDKGKIN